MLIFDLLLVFMVIFSPLTENCGLTHLKKPNSSPPPENFSQRQFQAKGVQIISLQFFSPIFTCETNFYGPNFCDFGKIRKKVSKRVIAKIRHFVNSYTFLLTKSLLIRQMS